MCSSICNPNATVFDHLFTVTAFVLHKVTTVHFKSDLQTQLYYVYTAHLTGGFMWTNLVCLTLGLCHSHGWVGPSLTFEAAPHNASLRVESNRWVRESYTVRRKWLWWWGQRSVKIIAPVGRYGMQGRGALRGLVSVVWRSPTINTKTEKAILS